MGNIVAKFQDGPDIRRNIMPKLAIKGGKPMCAPGDLTKVWPIVTQADVSAVTRVAASGKWGRLGTDTETEKFEAEFARYHDAKLCLAVSNGTVAIETALRAVGVEPGDEVIVTPLTFIASASGILLARAVPVFADIDPETYQISPEAIEAAITRRTAGMLVVHYGGYPCDMTATRAIARRRGLFVVEDCSHAHGTEWKGRKVGSFGDMGSFSFQASKSLSSGEGGAIITDKKKLWERAYAYHHIGRVPNSAKYDHTLFGSNYRLTEFQGAVLRTQLRKLQRQTETKMENAELFWRRIADIPGVVRLKPDTRITQRGYYYLVMRYQRDKMKGVRRDAFLAALRAEGLPAGSAYGQPVYHMPAFANRAFGKKGCPVECGYYGKKIDYSKVCLPDVERACYEEQMVFSHMLFMRRSTVAKLAAGIRKVYENLDELL